MLQQHLHIWNELKLFAKRERESDRSTVASFRMKPMCLFVVRGKKKLLRI